jgi:hypothetical protein
MNPSFHDSTLNYFHWDSGDCTAVFAFESCAHNDDEYPPGVVRRYRDCDFLHEDVGRTLGHGLGQTCALLIKASAGDLITIHETIRGGVRAITFTVKSDYTLELIADGLSLREVEVLELLNPQRPHERGRLRVNEKDLEVLFYRTSPAWLSEVLNRQLTFWRRHHTEHYLHYCPLDIPSEEIFRGVKGSPFWVLARFNRRLNSMQRTLCCKRTPLAPIFLHWSPMSMDDRKWKLSQYAAEILKYAAGRFDQDDLRICAQLQPLVALEYRQYLDQQKQDAALAGMALSFSQDELGLYPTRWTNGIAASIERDPSLWVRTFEGDFERLFSVIGSVPPSHKNGGMKQMLLDRLNGREKEAFESYICSRV